MPTYRVYSGDLTYRFWFVWDRDGRAPTRKHESRESAEREARRLANQHPGRSFIVLESVGEVRAPIGAAEYTPHHAQPQESALEPVNEVYDPSTF